MSGDVVVKMENVSKYYKLYSSPRDRLKEALNPFRKKYHKEFYALNNISFELRKGECLGVIGKNGMGKSTLLKIIANVIQPSSGNIQVNGTVSALLELGTGFNPEFTGLENIYFYGTVLGFKKEEIQKKVEEIIEFADIGEFIYQPVKTYSSGMFVRLAFAVQTSLKSDILLVDEVLSVGDIFFQQKCHARIEELMSNGTALILVSHDTQMIEKYSNHVILLHNGNILQSGQPNEVVYSYYRMEKNDNLKIIPKVIQNYTKQESSRIALSKDIPWPSENNFIQPLEVYASPKAICKKIALCDKNYNACTHFKIGETAYLFYEIHLLEEIGFPYGMATIINSKNIVVHAKDTLQYDTNNYPFTSYAEGTMIRFVQSFKLSVAEGEYTISIGFGNVSPENVGLIKKIDYTKRSNYMESILGIVKPLSFAVAPDSSGINFPFHGYVDLDGSFVMSFNNIGL